MRTLLALTALLLALVVGTSTAAAVDRTATPATFASVLAASSSGDTILLASGSYGTFAGTNKAVTIKADAGATPTMKLNLAAGDSGFTLEGISGLGGTVRSGHTNITIRNSSFTSSLDYQGQPGANFVINGGHFDWNARYNGGINSKLFVYSNQDGANSGLTVKNSTFTNGDLDGIHIGGSAGADILNNKFSNLCDVGTNHTDNLQTEGMVGGRIAGNYFYAAAGCDTQGLTSFDSGTVGVLIEDNVIDIRRPWGIEWYSDNGSIIRHNTVRYYPGSQCNFNATCGQIDLGHKSADPATRNTQVYDNIAEVSAVGATGVRNDHNQNGPGVVFVGPTTTWAGYALAPGSLGKGAASDGLDLGIRTGTTPPDPTPTPTPSPDPSPTPTPTPPPADQPADAVWTAPSGVRTGVPVTLDGSRSTGDAPLSCLWQFEDGAGGIVQTRTGCVISFTFQATGTKYVRLVVTDADGDTDRQLRTFTVTR